MVPGVRFAVDAYVNFARTRPWVEAVASSLTELFAPDLMAERLAAFERHYPWIDPRGARLLPGPPDAGPPRLRARPGGGDRALPDTGRRRRAAVAALSFKCDVLWSLLDAIDQAYADESMSGAAVPAWRRTSG